MCVGWNASTVLFVNVRRHAFRNPWPNNKAWYLGHINSTVCGLFRIRGFNSAVYGVFRAVGKGIRTT